MRVVRKTDILKTDLSFLLVPEVIFRFIWTTLWMSQWVQLKVWGLTTFRLKGSSGKKQSSCNSHGLWRHSAVFSPTWGRDDSALGPCWESLVLTLENHVFVVPCAMVNEALSHPSSSLGWQWLRHSTWGHHLFLLNLFWWNYSHWEKSQKNSLSYEVLHRRHYPKLMFHTLHSPCTQLLLISSFSSHLMFGHLD